jgi:hypothetical protein
MGSSNGVATNSWNIKREIVDAPGLGANTTITYQAMLGRWTGGTVFFNYAGYTGGSSITIMEIAQ